MVSNAVKLRLKALRRKHHLGEFRIKRSKHRVKHKIKVAYKMAKRRRSSFGKRARRLNSSLGNSLTANVIGVGGYIAYEAFLAPKVPLSEPTKSIAEIGVGYYLAKKGGILGNVGKTAIVLGTYKLMSQYVAPMIMGQSAPADDYSG